MKMVEMIFPYGEITIDYPDSHLRQCGVLRVPQNYDDRY